jgi:hypothetical protein
MVSRDTEPIDGSASPRKPSERMSLNVVAQLGRAVASDREFQFLGRDAGTVIGYADETEAAAGRDDLDRVAPASSAFSTSSLTTLAGRSITSPAAIWLIIVSESRRMGMPHYTRIRMSGGRCSVKTTQPTSWWTEVQSLITLVPRYI